MKIMGMCIALAAAGLGAAIGNHAESRLPAQHSSVVRGCAVPDGAAAGYRRRANLFVENTGRGSLRIRLDARPGTGLPATDLGRVDAGEAKFFASVLPAGRNRLTAAGSDGKSRQHLVHVVNRGDETCVRRYLWRMN